MKNSIQLIIFFGFLVRSLVAFYNGFYDFSFGQTADPGSIHGFGVMFSQDISIAHCEVRIRYAISCWLGLIYFLTTDSLFIGSMLSVFAWLGSALIFAKTMRFFPIEKSIQRKATLVYVLFPSSIIFTSVTLTESYQLLLVNLIVYAFFKIYYHKSYMYWLMIIFASILGAFLHSTIVVFGGFVTILGLFMLAGRSYKGFQQVKLLFVIPLIVLISVLVIENVSETIEKTGGQGLDEKAGIAQSIQRHQTGGIITNVMYGSGTLYRFEISLKDDYDLMLFVPTALFQYLFEPMPWKLVRPGMAYLLDLELFLENLLRGFLIWLALKRFCKSSSQIRGAGFFVILCYFFIETVWAIGTMNWGTAARHHTPSLGILILAAFMCLQPKTNKAHTL